MDFETIEKGGAENPFVAKFQAFFETQCMKQIEKLVAEYPQKKSLVVDFNDLEHYDFQLADELIENPDVLTEAAESAVQNIDIPMLELEEFKPHVRFFNLPKDRMPLLRDIGSLHIGKFISVEGLIRMMTDVLPKLKVASWQCRRCGNTYKIEQETQTIKQPAICECKHKDFLLLEEQSEFVDYQKIQIQEPLEQIKGSEQATNIDVYVNDDLVNKVAPGDHTRICGIIRLRKPKEQGAVFNRYLDAIHLEETAKDFNEVEITKEEEAEIKKLAANPRIYDMLTKSVAPNIFGHETVKEAIILQLFGGVKKILPNGTSIRGNAHVLLVGDPGVGKSQILQAVHLIAPKSIYIAGKTSTSAGISATAVKDEFGEGGWTLKAGALVLASGGMCMVDEMDKMECLTSDSLVSVENGELKPIGEIFEDAKKEGVTEKTEKGTSIRGIKNKFVLSMDKNLKIAPKRLIAVHQYPYNGRFLQVRLQSGETIFVTPNHPFFSGNEKGICTIKAGFLKKGDFVLVPKRIPGENMAQANPELHRLYGYLAGDGNVTYNPPENYLIRFTNKDSALLEDFSNCCGMIFEKPVIFPSEVRNDGVICERLSGKKIVDAIAQNAPGLMEKYSEKYTPKTAFNSPENTSAFLRSVFDSEGSVDMQHNQISFSNTSLRLVAEVKALLLKNSILSQMRKIKVTGKRRTAFLLRITDCDSLQLFQNTIGFTHPHKKAKLEKITEKRNRERTILNIIPNTGHLLKQIRLGLGLKQKECGINQAAYCNFEKQKANISAKKAEKVLAAFQKAALLKKPLPETTEKIAFFGQLVQGDILWRKVQAIKETSFPEVKKTVYAPIHNINALLARLGLKPISPRREKEELEPLRKKLVEKFGQFEKITLDSWADIKQTISIHAISQSAMARALAVSQPTLSRWLANQTTPPKNALSKTAQAILKELTAQKDIISRLFEQIEKLNQKQQTYIYDLTVEESHNFIANNIIVHNSEDRSAMHESMEQGMISVAKAGIVTRFKTDTSILAAANPKFSRFSLYENFLEQIDLPASLISRFDLFFMIRDVLDRKRDEETTNHILNTHMAGEIALQEKSQGKTMQRSDTAELKLLVEPEIGVETLKKYVSYARQNVFPVLSKEAIKMLSDYYVNLREMGKKEDTYSATPRQLEGLVRLSEASARVRLSDIVEVQDTERAIRLMRTSLQDLVTDKETGKIDIDLITTGQSQSQVNKMKKILHIISSKAKEEDRVPVQEIIEEMAAENMLPDEVRDIISKLKKKGDIYEPGHGFVMPTQKA